MPDVSENVISEGGVALATRKATVLGKDEIKKGYTKLLSQIGGDRARRVGGDENFIGLFWTR